MKITEFALKRPVTIAMAVLVVLLLGAVSLGRLSVDLFPEITFPVGAVVTNYSGAGPEEVESQVTRPLEQSLATVNNLKSIRSISSKGTSVVIAQFNWGTDMDFASLKMREKVDLVKTWLPDDAETPVVFTMDPSLMPVMQVNLFAPDADELDKMTEDIIQPRLERVDGVASVERWGGRQREIQVIVNSSKLQGYGLSINQVTQALQSENFNTPAGDVTDGNKELLVRVTGEFKNIKQIEEMVVDAPGGSPVHLYEIADVIDGQKEISEISRVDGQPGVALFIQKQSTANTVKVSQEVRKALAELKEELPAGYDYKIVMDQADFIEHAIKGVFDSAVKGALLAVLVLLFFLRNLRSTLIISTAIPISIIGTCILMYFNEISLNMISLGGLALGIGLIVDDAIVVLENIYRHRQEGEGLMEAALNGTSEVGNAVIAATLTTVVVFLPVVYVQGIAAQFFTPMALTLAFSVGVSLAVALTLVPILCSRLLHLTKPREGTRWSKLYSRSGEWFDALDRKYRCLLEWALGNKKKVIIAVTVLMAASCALVPFVGGEFIPSMDEGRIGIDIELPAGTALSETDRVALQVEEIVNRIPEVDFIYTNVGTTIGMMGGDTASNIASVQMKLVPKSERERSDEEIVEVLRQKVARIPGAEFKVSAVDFFTGAGMGSPIEIKIKGDDLEVLERLADRSVELVSKVPGTRQVESSLGEGRPEVQVKINRDKAAGYGLSVYQVAQTVKTAVGGSVATHYRSGGDEVDIRVRMAGAENARLQDLGDLTVASPLGMQVLLKELAAFDRTKGPVSIQRSDQSRMVTVTGQIIGRDLNSIMKDIRLTLDKNLVLPPGYVVEYGGQEKEMRDSFANLGLALVLSVFLVYMVMAAQFESLLHPFVIMFAIPVTLIGIVFSLLVTGRPLSVPAFIGIIMLGGIVVKNAIVLVDYVNLLRRRGVERYEAIITAGPRRLRPILMTALTAIFAMLPLALGLKEGSEAEAPLATVVVGGLIFSTLITLVLVPVLYVIFEDLGAGLKRRLPFFNRKGEAEEEVPPVNQRV